MGISAELVLTRGEDHLESQDFYHPDVSEAQTEEAQSTHRYQVISLGGLGYAEDHGIGFSSIIGFHKYKVLSSKGKWPYGLLGIIVIHWDPAVSQKHPEIFFLIYAVG